MNPVLWQNQERKRRSQEQSEVNFERQSDWIVESWECRVEEWNTVTLRFRIWQVTEVKSLARRANWKVKSCSRWQMSQNAGRLSNPGPGAQRNQDQCRTPGQSGPVDCATTGPSPAATMRTRKNATLSGMLSFTFSNIQKLVRMDQQKKLLFLFSFFCFTVGHTKIGVTYSVISGRFTHWNVQKR